MVRRLTTDLFLPSRLSKRVRCIIISRRSHPFHITVMIEIERIKSTHAVQTSGDSGFESPARFHSCVGPMARRLTTEKLSVPRPLCRVELYEIFLIFLRFFPSFPVASPAPPNYYNNGLPRVQWAVSCIFIMNRFSRRRALADHKNVGHRSPDWPPRAGNEARGSPRVDGKAKRSRLPPAVGTSSSLSSSSRVLAGSSVGPKVKWEVVALALAPSLLLRARFDLLLSFGDRLLRFGVRAGVLVFVCPELTCFDCPIASSRLRFVDRRGGVVSPGSGVDNTLPHLGQEEKT
jgi:hypothetical protein